MLSDFRLSLRTRLAAFVACWLPARRAARLDPLEALRADYGSITLFGSVNSVSELCALVTKKKLGKV